MKIAICISGLVRTYRDTFPSYQQNLLQTNADHHIDVFLSTWDEEDSMVALHTDRLAQRRRRRKPICRGLDINNLWNAYRPKHMLVEKQQIFPESEQFKSNIQPFQNPAAFYSMWYKIRNCDRLREDQELLDGKMYDIVVRTRFDINYPEPIDFSVVKNDVIAVPLMPTPNYEGYVDLGVGLINDKFAYGPPNLMSIYTKVTDTAPDHFANGVKFMVEAYLALHLKQQGVPTETLPYDMPIIRPAKLARL